MKYFTVKSANKEWRKKYIAVALRRIKYKLIFYDLEFHNSRISAIGLFAYTDKISRFVLSDRSV
jgi:hypothetical protein